MPVGQLGQLGQTDLAPLHDNDEADNLTLDPRKVRIKKAGRIKC